MTFFSYHPIFLDQSLQHTGFAPLFTQLTNETPHFAPPLQIVLYKNFYCPPSLRKIYPNFRELLCKSFKNTCLVTDFAPPLAVRPGTTVLPAPPYATVSNSILCVAVMAPSLFTIMSAEDAMAYIQCNHNTPELS